MTVARPPIATTYRPRRLGDLIGQDVLVRTLRGAFASGRTVHAYLLTGPRGTGKTSTARILAACFNCAEGASADPCGRCPQCTAIARDAHMDVLEIDAASYTGVENIRELQQTLRYAPSEGRAKVVIIDEVHMLSRGAFNALLKTLEEPPAHVVFVMATTEPRKVPATILSRVQRFDLRPVPLDTLIAHYTWVCEQEGADAEADALGLIARAAGGSVRDGLSILGQAIADGAGAVTAANVREMLALGDAAASAEVLRTALLGDAAAARQALADLLAAGADPATVLGDMLAVLHGAAVAASAAGQASDAGLEDRTAEVAEELGAALSAREIQDAWTAVGAGLADLQTLPDPGRAAEMTLLGVCRASKAPAA